MPQRILQEQSFTGTEELKFRPIEDTDVEHLHILLNDPDNQKMVGGSVTPMSNSQVLQWLQNKRTKEDACQFAIEVGGDFCGYIQLASVDRLNGSAILGINILKRFQGIGLGRIVIQRMHDFAKRNLLLRKIVLYVRSDNQPAVRLYLSAGYQRIGALTQHVRTVSGYVDLEIMELML